MVVVALGHIAEFPTVAAAIGLEHMWDRNKLHRQAGRLQLELE